MVEKDNRRSTSQANFPQEKQEFHIWRTVALLTVKPQTAVSQTGQTTQAEHQTGVRQRVTNSIPVKGHEGYPGWYLPVELVLFAASPSVVTFINI